MNTGLHMDFVPLFSGSSGNSTYVRMEGTSLLVDAGLSGTRVIKELQKLQVDPSTLSGILVTHEHSDHVSGVGILSRRYGLKVYATQGTWAGMAGKVGRIEACNRRVIRPGDDFFIGDMCLTPFSIPHDAAEPVGYTFYCRGVKTAIATDLGHLNNGWLDALAGSALVLLEANHDVEMLKAGRYPYELKRRILGMNGHLSNEDAGRAVIELRKQGVGRIILGHLSHENNFPELAYQTVSQVLEEAGHAVDMLDVAQRDGLTGIYHLKSEDQA